MPGPTEGEASAPQAPPLRVVAGLGNFRGYDLTPHNIGYETVDRLADESGLSWRDKDDYWLASAADDAYFLVKTQTYMNVSGPVIQRAAAKVRAPAAGLLIVLDDFALPWGRLRLRRSGSAGGHNGLASVLTALGGLEVPRLRIGVGPVPAGQDSKDYVLARQPKDRIKALAVLAADAVRFALENGLDAAMNRFNAAP